MKNLLLRGQAGGRNGNIGSRYSGQSGKLRVFRRPASQENFKAWRKEIGKYDRQHQTVRKAGQNHAVQRRSPSFRGGTSGGRFFFRGGDCSASKKQQPFFTYRLLRKGVAQAKFGQRQENRPSAFPPFRTGKETAHGAFRLHSPGSACSDPADVLNRCHTADYLEHRRGFRL